MATRIQLRHDTAVAWVVANPVLAQGEIGVEVDTLLVKVGNGSTTWNNLSYLTSAALAALNTEITNRIVGDAAKVAKTGDNMTGDLAMGGHLVTGLADPASGQDAATRAYVLAVRDALVGGAPGLLDTLAEIDTQLSSDESVAAALATAIASKQPIDSDLTAIAALTTTAFGRSFLTLVDAGAAQALLGLGSAATHAVTDFDAAGAAATAQAASQPLDSDLTAIAALATTTFGRALLALVDASALQTAAGLGTAATHDTTDFIAATDKGVAGGVATLDGSGLIPTAQMPPLAINEVFVVGSQAGMLALTAQRGDAARRTDSTPNKLFLLTTDDPTQLANWLDLSTTDVVSTVDGRVGAVSLADRYDALGAAATGDATEATARATADAAERRNALALSVFMGA